MTLASVREYQSDVLKVEGESRSPIRSVSATTSASAPKPASPLRAGSTSLFRYSPGLLLITIAIADAIRAPDPDLWGHIRFGQAVLASHHLVHFDPYSYSVPGHLWNNHEWLSELLMAAIFNYAGVIGLVLMKLAATAAVVLFLAGTVAETSSSTLVQFAVVLYCAVMIKPQLQFRPQLFTFVLFALLIWLFTRDAYRRTGRLWLAIPILALWANLHGGFIIGIAALGIYTAVSGFQDIAAGRGFTRLVQLAAITAAATIATLATPYGFATWTTVAHALRNPYTRALIQDWEPLIPAMIERWPQHGLIPSNFEIGVFLMAVTAISWLVSIEAIDLPLFAIAAAMMVGAVLSVRNLPLAAIAIAAPLTRHLPRAFKWRFLHGPAHPPRSSWLNQCVLAGLSLAIFVHSGLFSPRLISPDPFPVGACDFMQAHRLSGNVLCDFAWGEYVIWRMAPDSKVFIDGRYDTVFPLSVIRQYVIFHLDAPGAAAVLHDYPHDFVLIKPDSPSRPLMDMQADWKLIYQDRAARLYARTGSAAAELTASAVPGPAPRTTFP